jgi:hypothetical protein
MMIHNLTESSLFFPGSHTGYFFLILLAQVERWKAQLESQHETHRRLGQLTPVAARSS